jgi:hypothetical protein
MPENRGASRYGVPGLVSTLMSAVARSLIGGALLAGSAVFSLAAFGVSAPEPFGFWIGGALAWLAVEFWVWGQGAAR